MTRIRWRGAAMAILVGATAILGCADPVAAAEPSGPSPPPYAIRWVSNPSDTNKVTVEVSGLGDAVLWELRRLEWTPAQWQRLLSAYAEQGELVADIGVPPMSGEYQAREGSLRFVPLFPPEPGVRYRAIFRPDQLPGASGTTSRAISAVFVAPSRNATPTTVVNHVYPSADVVPENLLKFYVHFSAPMSRGHIYEHIHLRDAAGKDIELPFLEIDEELWNPEMTRLTLFIDPGRIKRGVRPLEEIGPSLEAGNRYTLVIDRDWRDAAGAPLKELHGKTFQVGPSDRDPPDPATWKVQPPASRGRSPLTVTFPEPMDHALAQRVIRVTSVSGNLIEGNAAMEDHERRWCFTPIQPWGPGPHHLVIQTTIEDLAGNNIGKTFEVDLFKGVQRRLTNSIVKLTFEVP